MFQIMDGKAVSLQIKDELANEVRGYVARGLRPPHLAAILVGDDGASQTYVANKEKSAHEVGFVSSVYRYSANTEEEELLRVIDFLNNDDEIDGFIVQLPLPKHINEQNIINNIIANRRRGKTHHIVINAEGIGHSVSMARRIEAATGIETRATILGYMQRGGQPTAKDRYYASIMGAYAVDILLQGKTNRVVGFSKGEFVDYDIEEALNMVKGINEYQFEVAHLLSY